MSEISEYAKKAAEKIKAQSIVLGIETILGAPLIERQVQNAIDAALAEERAKAERLVEALTTPLSDPEAKGLDGVNDAWVDWYLKNSIVNSARGRDTDSHIIARIFRALKEREGEK